MLRVALLASLIWSNAAFRVANPRLARGVRFVPAGQSVSATPSVQTETRFPLVVYVAFRDQITSRHIRGLFRHLAYELQFIDMQPAFLFWEDKEAAKARGLLVRFAPMTRYEYTMNSGDLRPVRYSFAAQVLRKPLGPRTKPRALRRIRGIDKALRIACEQFGLRAHALREVQFCKRYYALETGSCATAWELVFRFPEGAVRAQILDHGKTVNIRSFLLPARSNSKWTGPPVQNGH